MEFTQVQLETVKYYIFIPFPYFWGLNIITY